MDNEENNNIGLNLGYEELDANAINEEESSSSEWIFQNIFANASEGGSTDANNHTNSTIDDFQITPDLVSELFSDHPTNDRFDQEIINNVTNDDLPLEIAFTSTNILDQIEIYELSNNDVISQYSANDINEIFYTLRENLNVDIEIEILCLLFSRMEIHDQNDPTTMN